MGQPVAVIEIIPQTAFLIAFFFVVSTEFLIHI